ncbi:MAG TPA: DedA family protein [Dissulfurispiraceae bacterium]|nr:DedA family protein [Dissulfurispiraceae bacterium]
METSIIHHFPYLGLFVLLVMGVIGFPFPEDAILILCGFLIANGVVQPVPALVVVAFGMITTDFFLYHVGRKYGRKVVAHRRFRRIITQRREARLEKIFRKWGAYVIFLGRHLLGLRSQIFLVAGILRMPRLKFVVADAVSSVVTISIMVGAGYWGGNTLELIKKDMEEARYALIILIAIVGLTLLIWRLAVRRLRQDNDDADE